MIPAEKIIVALDFSDKSEFLSFLESIKGEKVWIKIGMELFYSIGSDAVEEAKKRGFKIFLDLKLHDIPNTVEQALRSLIKNDIDMINIHAAGGSEMMKRASQVIKSSERPPLLIAVTQLTSTTQHQMNLEQQINGDILRNVIHYAQLAQACGCDGVVSSPLEVQEIKRLCGPKFLTVTPGIRPMNGQHQDQSRVTTPNEAIELGSDYLVIGRPITKANNPRLALNNIIKGY